MDPRTRPSWPSRLAALALIAAMGQAVLAQSLPYSVTLAPVGEEELDAALENASNLISLAAEAPPGAAGLIRRIEADRDRLEAVLRSYGYYAGTVDITVAGRPLGDPALQQFLERTPPPVPVAIAVSRGPLYHVASIELMDAASRGQAPAIAIDTGELGLAVGDPATAAAVLDAEAEIIRRMQQAGHPFAAVPERRAIVDHAARTMAVTYFLAAGPVATLGPVAFTGMARTDDGFLAGRVPFEQGEPYSPDKIRELRESVTELGIFSSVAVAPDDMLNDEGELPIDVTVEERPPRVIGFGLGYETGVGFNAEAYWRHRNLFGRAETLEIRGQVGGVGGSGDGIDYGLSFGLGKPDVFFPGLDLATELAVLAEHPEGYDREAVTASAIFSRELSDRLTVTGGFEFELSRITDLDEQDGDRTTDYLLFGVPLTVAYDTRDSDVEPTEGYRLGFELEPFLGLSGGAGSFVVARATGSTYFNLDGEGRYVLAVRGTLGSILGASTGDIPPNRRFYAGGGGSVRGYAFQSIAPEDDDGDPFGGRSLVEAGIELRIRLGEDWGVVPFLEMGSVSDSSFPDFSEPARFSAGIGVRYYTGFGPLRLDVGVPLNPDDDDDAFGLYVSLGQAF